jgi:hypothetical protein
MELNEFQTIVTFLSLLISITSLVVTLGVVWSRPSTVIVQAEPLLKVDDEASQALNNKIDDINKRLFDK